MVYSRYQSAWTARKPDGVVVKMDQRWGVPTVHIVVVATLLFRCTRPKIQGVHQRTGWTARLPETSCRPGGKLFKVT